MCPSILNTATKLGKRNVLSVTTYNHGICQDSRKLPFPLVIFNGCRMLRVTYSIYFAAIPRSFLCHVDPQKEKLRFFLHFFQIFIFVKNYFVHRVLQQPPLSSGIRPRDTDGEVQKCSITAKKREKMMQIQNNFVPLQHPRKDSGSHCLLSVSRVRTVETIVLAT